MVSNSGNWQFEEVVENQEGQVNDMSPVSSSDTYIEETDTVEENSSKRGRGRPPGAKNLGANNANGLDSLKAEISELRNLVQSQNIKIMNLENRAPSVSFNGPEFPPDFEKRLDVIQRWVETLHLFLNTGRITNSVDGAAEEELELVISKLPEITINIHD